MSILLFTFVIGFFFPSFPFSQPPDPSQIPEPQIAYALGSSRVSGRVQPNDQSNDCILAYKSIRLEDWKKYIDWTKKPLLIPINTKSFSRADYDLIDWLPILSGRPGNWALVLEAREGQSYSGAYKSHTPKWALPVGGEVYTPSAAFFNYRASAGKVGNELWNVLPYRAILKWDTSSNYWTIFWEKEEDYWTRYHDWRWWDNSNRQFITEPINSGQRDIKTMMRALRRTGIWFYIGHSTYVTNKGIPYLLFGEAIWGANGFVVSSKPPIPGYNPFYGSINWTPKHPYYAISDLPDGDLSYLRLAVIVACAGAGGDLPQSYPLLDQIVAKGCPLALGLVMNTPLTAGTEPPPGINEKFAKDWVKWFWYYVTEGIKEEIKDEHNNVLQQGGRWDVLAAANMALYKAAGKRNSRPRFGTGIYSGVIVVDGPSRLGARPYSVYIVHKPQIVPSNYCISPARGGRDDRALRVMVTSNLHP